MTHRRSEGTLGEARAYHPRGRTVREQQRTTRAAAPRGSDPLRSALHVFDDDEPVEPPARAATSGARRKAATSHRTATQRRPPAPRQPAPESQAEPSGRSARPRTPAGSRTQAAPRKPAPPAKRNRPAKPASAARPARAAKPAKPAKPSKPAKPATSAPRTTAAAPGPARPPKLANPRRRLRLATVLALTLFAVLGLRLVELQLTDGPAYAASGQQNRLQEIVLPAERGSIFDRNGAVLAHSVEARYVFADPELVEDPPEVARRLQPLLGVPASELLERMRPTTREDGTRSRFEWLARGVDTATAEEIMALNLPGIGIDRDERRIVPGNDLAANLIGFTGEDLTGLEGLEAQFDDVLRGVDGQRIYESGQGSSEDIEIPGGYRQETPPQPGSDLRLTVDMDLQYEVQSVLADRLREADASFGAAVVLDIHTGQVLAQASYPTYNAADPLAASERDRVDAASATVFDPGSAHKPLVVGAALQEGVIEAGDTIEVDPSIVKGDQAFQDAIPHAAGTELTLPEILAYSSNVGTIRIADLLGKEKLYDYQRAFGLGEATGVGMPGEATGALLPPQQWYGSSYGSVPIGHSVSATTLQMAAAYGTIANDGVWVQPRLVQAVVPPEGEEEPAADPATRRVLSAEHAAQLREMMEAVTTVPGATGLSAAVDGYRVAGKTGTGKLVVDGEYAPGDVASFVGMAPAESPRYVVAVVAHTPHGGGGEVASPAFRKMMGFALNHYRVPPSGSEAPAFELSR